MPDELWLDLDHRSKKWGGNRSAAITRIYLEWLEMSQAQAVTPKNLKNEPAMIAV